MSTPAPIGPSEFADELAAAWLEINPREDYERAVIDTRWRHSNAGKCARYLQYDLLGIEPSEPLTYSARMVFKMGDHVHDELQSAFVQYAKTQGWDCELEARGHSVWMDGSLHSDAKLTFPGGESVVVEIKSTNGFSYKKSVGGFKGNAEGPRSNAILQGAMNACSTEGCIGLYIVLASHEAISVRVAHQQGIPDRGRILHAWWYPIETCVEIATPEYERLSAIGEWLDRAADEHGEYLANLTAAGAVGEEPPEPPAPAWIPRAIPTLPKGARIANPMTGLWTVEREGLVLDTGEAWECSYCAFQTRCHNDGP